MKPSKSPYLKMNLNFRNIKFHCVKFNFFYIELNHESIFHKPLHVKNMPRHNSTSLEIEFVLPLVVKNH